MNDSLTKELIMTLTNGVSFNEFVGLGRARDEEEIIRDVLARYVLTGEGWTFADTNRLTGEGIIRLKNAMVALDRDRRERSNS